MSIGDSPDFTEEFWRREPLWGIIFFWLVNALLTLFLMNVLLSIIVDGYIETNGEKKDGTSIIASFIKAGTIRQPKQLGSISFEGRSAAGGSTTRSRRMLGDEDREKLTNEIDKVLDDVRLSRTSVAKSRQKVLDLITYFVDNARVNGVKVDAVAMWSSLTGFEPPRGVIGGGEQKDGHLHSGPTDFDNPMHVGSQRGLVQGPAGFVGGGSGDGVVPIAATTATTDVELVPVGQQQSPTADAVL